MDDARIRKAEGGHGHKSWSCTRESTRHGFADKRAVAHADAAGLCQNHYHQRYKGGGALKPIRA